jgi:2-polyprenyl-3-methyl-5-hydroxy-6-metoxy-1,4-benzoquinol methylase
MSTPKSRLQWHRIVSCYVFTFLEILASRLTMFERLLIKWRTPAFSKEISLLQVAPEEKVLHIGCGAYPSASLDIARGRHANVVGIDNNIIAVRLAQAYIKKKQLTSLIKVELADGVSYPLADFNVIFIAINVWPIDAVLSHCARTMKPTARILVKGSHDDLTAVLDKEEFRHAFSIGATLKHPNSESFLLKKK